MAPIDPSSRESPEKLRRIAFHEAGHTVAAFVLDHTFTRVVIDREPSPLDESDDQPRHCVDWSDGLLLDEMELHHAEARALFAFAGDAAEMHLVGGRPAGEIFDHGVDYSLAFTAAWKFFPENRQRHAFLEEMEDRAHAFVSEPLRWHQIQTLAAALLDQHDLTRAEVVGLLNHATKTFEPPA